jgi:hypothetical protein
VEIIKNASSIPLYLSQEPLGNHNRFAEELKSEQRVVATAADFTQTQGQR